MNKMESSTVCNGKAVQQSRQVELHAHYSTQQRKRATKRLETVRTELKACRSTPQINSASRHMKDETKEAQEHATAPMTHRVAELLRTAEKPPVSNSEIKVNLTTFSVSLAAEPKTPSTHSRHSRHPQVFETSHGLAYHSIKQLMLSSPPKTPQQRPVAPPTGDIAARSKHWLQQKEARLQQAREQGTAGSAFVPKPRPQLKVQSTSLTPTSKYLSYASGFNYAEF